MQRLIVIRLWLPRPVAGEHMGARGAVVRDDIEPQERVHDLPVVDGRPRAVDPRPDGQLTVSIRRNRGSDDVVPAARGMSAWWFCHDDDSNPFDGHLPDATVTVTDDRPVGDAAAPGAKERLGHLRWRWWFRAAHDLAVASHLVAAIGRHGIPAASADDAVGASPSDQAVIATQPIENVVTSTAVDEIRLCGSAKDVGLFRSDDPLERRSLAAVGGEHGTDTGRCREARDRYTDDGSPAHPMLEALHGLAGAANAEEAPQGFSVEALVPGSAGDGHRDRGEQQVGVYEG